jgi:predicted MFS family arabinose efflux permease
MLRRPDVTRHQITVLCICVGVFALGQFHRASGGVFTPILMDRFALSAATVGGLVSAMFLASILAQIPFGVALDRIGPRRVLAACMILIAAGTVLFAVAGGFGPAVLSRVLIGIGLASMGAATHIIIARNFSRRDFGYISGLVVTLGSVGGMMGTFPLAFALERADWTLVFGGVALVTLVLAALIWIGIRPQGPRDPQATPRGGFGVLLRRAEFLKILCLGVVSYTPITTITGLWGGPYLQDVVGLTAEEAGGVLLILFMSMTGAGFVFGMLDRHARSRRRVILGGAVVSCAALGLLAAIPVPSVMVAAGLLIVMVCAQHFFIPLGAHMRRVVPDAMLGRGSTLLAVVSVGAIPAMQVAFGGVLDGAAAAGLSADGQYRVAFAGMAGVIALGAMIYATARQVNETTETSRQSP